MKLRSKFIYPANSTFLPNTKALDGSGAIVSTSTIATTGNAPFEFVVDFDPATITETGTKVLEEWKKYASDFSSQLA